MTEMVDRIGAMNAVVDLPLIADADTGFGRAVNVVRTVKEYERAGASAIHIEDQLTLKRPTYQGFEGGFITRAEMVDKIRAALDARPDENLLIVARCDVPDKQEKIERLRECLEAGADVAWLAGGNDEAIRSYTQAIGDKPSLGVLPRGMTLRQYQDAGASCGVILTVLQVAALCAMKGLLEVLKNSGTADAYLSSLPYNEKMTRFYGNQGNDELKRIEEGFSGLPSSA